MTPTQLDHLNQIKLHLETLLANAEKRTPGEWSWKERGKDSAELIEPCIFLGGSSLLPWGQQHSNAAFIASCAGNAEAGWRSTLAAIKGISNYSILAEDMEEVLDSILAAWPLESLKL